MVLLLSSLFICLLCILQLFFAESLCFLQEAKFVPKGSGKYKTLYISIYLVSVDSKDFDHHKKVKANCSICIKDQIDGGCNKRLSCKIIFILMVLVFNYFVTHFTYFTFKFSLELVFLHGISLYEIICFYLCQQQIFLWNSC